MNNSGTLGENKKKETDRQPDYKGKCEVDGKTYWLSAWVKEHDGEEFLSLAFTLYETDQEQRKSSAKKLRYNPRTRPKVQSIGDGELPPYTIGQDEEIPF